MLKRDDSDSTAYWISALDQDLRSLELSLSLTDTFYI